MEQALWEVNKIISKNGGPIPLSRGGIYRGISTGEIPCVKIGGRLFIPDWYVKKITSESKK